MQRMILVIITLLGFGTPWSGYADVRPARGLSPQVEKQIVVPDPEVSALPGYDKLHAFVERKVLSDIGDMSSGTPLQKMHAKLWRDLFMRNAPSEKWHFFFADYIDPNKSTGEVPLDDQGKPYPIGFLVTFRQDL